MILITILPKILSRFELNAYSVRFSHSYAHKTSPILQTTGLAKRPPGGKEYHGNRSVFLTILPTLSPLLQTRTFTNLPRPVPSCKWIFLPETNCLQTTLLNLIVVTVYSHVGFVEVRRLQLYARSCLASFTKHLKTMHPN